MNTYEHQEFLSTNKIVKDELPENLKMRITGFEEIQEDLKYLIENDKRVVEQTLKELDIEIAEELLDHFEEYLKNNLEEKSKPKDTNVSSDEQLLERFYNQKKYLLGARFLLQQGFEGPLNAAKHKVGKYLLKRMILSNEYRLIAIE